MHRDPLDMVVEGQFEDAVIDPSTALDHAPFYNPREGQLFIDDDLLGTSESDENLNTDSAGETATEDDEECGIRASNVNDEDWELAERDFTKQYNRLRQHISVQNAKTTNAQKVGISPLPAINRHHNPEPNTTRTRDQLVALSKYASGIASIDQPYGRMGISTNRKGPSERANLKDKSDRATNEQVLDPRTRLILLKMIGKGIIREVNGCISTGKEANVYHAFDPQMNHIAVKIFKTSILIFKDRDRYVTGERRFRRGYNRHNPRKMVRLWAEKEMRNLKRLVSVGILCPEPIQVRENVLLMRFMGNKAGWASPRLKDAQIPDDRLSDLYKELLLTVRKMFHECKLIHADLSEYNILYHESQLCIIDVGQSVEHDHPSAFDFLRADLKNVEEFFGRRGVSTLGVRRSFEFVVGEASHVEPSEGWLDKLLLETKSTLSAEDAELDTERVPSDDKVFMQSFIPRTLDAVYDPERDVDIIKEGKGASLIYSDVIGIVGMAADFSKFAVTSKEPMKDSDEASSFSATADEGSQNSEAGTFEKKHPRGHRSENREAKKLRKQAVKEAARERRKQKMPKAEKKRHVKATRP